MQVSHCTAPCCIAMFISALIGVRIDFATFDFLAGEGLLCVAHAAGDCNTWRAQCCRKPQSLRNPLELSDDHSEDCACCAVQVLHYIVAIDMVTV